MMKQIGYGILAIIASIGVGFGAASAYHLSNKYIKREETQVQEIKKEPSLTQLEIILQSNQPVTFFDRSVVYGLEQKEDRKYIHSQSIMNAEGYILNASNIEATESEAIINAFKEVNKDGQKMIINVHKRD